MYFTLAFSARDERRKYRPGWKLKYDNLSIATVSLEKRIKMFCYYSLTVDEG